MVGARPERVHLLDVLESGSEVKLDDYPVMAFVGGFAFGNHMGAGFVFANRSRRRTEVEVVAAAAREVPPFVTLVGVFQDQPISEVREIMAACGLHVAQLHGHESPDYIEKLGLPCLKAISLGVHGDLEKMARYPQERSFLLDSASGGSGEPFDHSLALSAMRYGRVILAGGLDPDNVGEAIMRVRPWGVDTASGVESAPGVKDALKIKLFIQKVREVDDSLSGLLQ